MPTLLPPAYPRLPPDSTTVAPAERSQATSPGPESLSTTRRVSGR